MQPTRTAASLMFCLTMGLALPAWAGDRVRAGQWETTVHVAGHAITRSVCISQSDAETINGDAPSLKAYIEKITTPAGCTVRDLTITGNQLKVASVCADGENVSTTTYDGDRSETVTTDGVQSESKRIGACK